MSRKRYIASDPTAWKAISWADRETEKKKSPPMAITLESGNKRKRRRKRRHAKANFRARGNDGLYKAGES